MYAVGEKRAPPIGFVGFVGQQPRPGEDFEQAIHTKFGLNKQTPQGLQACSKIGAFAGAEARLTSTAGNESDQTAARTMRKFAISAHSGWIPSTGTLKTKLLVAIKAQAERRDAVRYVDCGDPASAPRILCGAAKAIAEAAKEVIGGVDDDSSEILRKLGAIKFVVIIVPEEQAITAYKLKRAPTLNFGPAKEEDQGVIMFALTREKKASGSGTKKGEEGTDPNSERLGDMVLPLCSLPECVRPTIAEALLKEVLERALEDPDTRNYA
jgi:hypothetical protein